MQLAADLARTSGIAVLFTEHDMDVVFKHASRVIVLSGGECAALMVLDACIRLLPGVMGAAHSGTEESFENGLLEYPQFTRPVEWEGHAIPEVLRSGDHGRIAEWRKRQSESDTRLRRPDLWERHEGARVQPAYGARRKDEGK